MLSSDIGETVITSGSDFHNSGLPQDQGSESQHNLGKPQVVYLENAIPVAEGYTTVCYKPLEIPCVYKQGLEIWDTVRLQRPRRGIQYVHAGKNTTVAGVHHRAFIYDEGMPFITELLEDCTSVNHNIECAKEPVIGILEMDNRLVMYTKDMLYWGNIESGKEMQFEVSFSNLASATKPSDLKGHIVAAYPLGEGAVIYGTENAIYMEFNNNRHLRYRFSPILNVGGITDKKHVAYQANTGYHYAWTSNGLVKVKPRRESDLVFSDVSEFLQGDIIEHFSMSDLSGIENLEPVSTSCGDCNDTSGVTGGLLQPEVSTIINRKDTTHNPCHYPTTCPHIFEEIVACESLNKKLQLIGANYFAISYGAECENVYQYILLYDERLRRWGKLKIEHVAVFEAPNSSATSHNIAITKPDGTMVTVDTMHVTSIDCNDREVEDCQGVLVLGRYALHRKYITEIHSIDIQRVHPESNLEVRVYPSWDGFTRVTDTPEPCEVVRNVGVRSYTTRSSGLNHNIELIGVFKLTSLIIGYRTNGKVT